MNEILLWGHLCFLFDSLGGSEAGKIAKNSSGKICSRNWASVMNATASGLLSLFSANHLISARHDNVFVLFACALNIHCSFIFVYDCKPSAKSVKVCFLCDINNFHTKAANSTQNARKKATTNNFHSSSITQTHTFLKQQTIEKKTHNERRI